MDFKIKLTFLIEPFFIHDHEKHLKIFRTKGAFKVKKKHFSSFLKGFQLSKIVSDLRVRL